ncbi:MAG: hypothetical protein U7127_09370 [Phormidium sp.]
MYVDHFAPLLLILHSEIRGEKPIHATVVFALGKQGFAKLVTENVD